MLKNRRLLLLSALIYSIILLYFSLANANGIVPEIGLKFQDKVLHLVAYFVFALLWGLFALTVTKRKSLFISFIATFIFGIVLELIQENVNPLRTYDILDLISNCLGVIVGTIIVLLYSNKRKLK